MLHIRAQVKQELSGNTAGLAASHSKRLLATWRRRVQQRELVSPELARHLTELSRETGRQLGVLLNRRGEVEHVIVGDARQLELPDIGRARAGHARLRGLRLVHTHLKDEPLTRDDLTDLVLLRLDAVAAVEARPDGLPGKVYVATLMPWNLKGELYQMQDAPSLYDLEFDAQAQIAALEQEMARVAPVRAVGVEGRAMLVGVHEGDRERAETSMQELRELARTADVQVLDSVLQGRREIDPRTLVGQGKLEEILVRSMALGADLLVFDHDLTPSQARHIGEATSLRILDRTQLILDIFAQRAQSADGKLQVELAQLKYLLAAAGGPRRLALAAGRRHRRAWTGRDQAGSGPPPRARAHLRAGGAHRPALRRPRHPQAEAQPHRGAGHLHRRVHQRGQEHAAQRAHRLRRARGGQALRHAGSHYAAPALSPREREVIITDTVGFIRDLPKDLVNAFRATLEELEEANLLLHVVDASDPQHDEQARAVERILSGLRVEGTPRLLVYNKADLAPDDARTLALREDGVAVSSTTREGFSGLLARCEEILWERGKVLAPGEEPEFARPRY